MTARTIMIQGTASSVGKSLLVAGLCRLFAQEGLRVAPFKAQNMALNAAVTPEGGEIGRSTAVQALAAGVSPHVDMNPVLLKPEPGMQSQIILLGRPAGHLTSIDYHQRKQRLWAEVVTALDRLRSQFDLVVIEGAGSPAEINLREGDIVNMRVARHAHAPVLLVGDINLGGVFAHLYGTLALLLPEERSLVQGLIINKFRGDESLLAPGIRMLEELCSVPVVGVLPYLVDISVPEEDSVALEHRRHRTSTGPLDIVVVQLPHISNFDDFDQLASEPGVSLRFCRQPSDAGRPDLVILPGSKATVADLAWLQTTGFAGLIVALSGRGTPVLGICGGYQMLGEEICDPERVESALERVEGLGLLQTRTIFASDKTTELVEIEQGLAGPFAQTDVRARAYEIHMGRTEGAEQPLFRIRDRRGTIRSDGAWDAEHLVLGTYLHGLFESWAVRQALFDWLGSQKGVAIQASNADRREASFDALATMLRERIGVERLMHVTRNP